MSDWIPVPEIENVLIVLATLAETPEEIENTPAMPLLESLKKWDKGSVYVFHSPPEAGEVLEDVDPEMAAYFALAAQMSDMRAEVCRDALRRMFSRATVQRILMIDGDNPTLTVQGIDQYFSQLEELDMLWDGNWPHGFVLGMTAYHGEIFSDLNKADSDLRKAVEQVAAEKHLNFKVVSNRKQGA